MGDGRYDVERLMKAVAQNARDIAVRHGGRRQAGRRDRQSVMLGALAASGRLPISAEAFEAAIKQDGKAVESNLRGFA